MWQVRDYFKAIDLSLFINVLFLCMAGYCVLLSVHPERFASGLRNFVLSFFIMFFVCSRTPTELKRMAWPLYFVSLFLLLSVFFLGDVSKGARRWLAIGPVRLQPSEFMKVAAPLMLSSFFSQVEGKVRARHYFFSFLLLFLPVVLVLKEPDLGTALLIFFSGFFVIFFVGLDWRIVFLGILSVFLVSPFLCRTPFPHLFSQPLLHAYQCKRVTAFWDPYLDPFGSGYHTIQSVIAIGSGGPWGEGWRQGTQAHLDFVPEAHTDFAFAVFAEEFGFWGAMILLLLYGTLIVRCFWISWSAQTMFSRLLSGSLAATFFVYVFVNVGMVTGILPVVGVPLPYVSYGGSSMMSLFASLGLLMTIHRHRCLVSS